GAGCSQSPTKENAAGGAGKSAAGPEGNKGNKGGLDTRTSTAGRWQLMIAEQGAELPMMLVDISLEGEKPTAKMAALVPGFPVPLEIESAEVDRDSVRLTFTAKGQPADAPRSVFEGRFDDGEIIGGLRPNAVVVTAARLIPTEAKSLKGAAPSPLLLVQEFQLAAKSKNTVRELRDFAQKHPSSPLALDALQRVIMVARDAKLDDAT